MPRPATVTLRTVRPRGARRGPGPAHRYAAHEGLAAPWRELIAEVDGPHELLEEHGRGLPAGAARAEALAVRLRRAGVPLRVAGERELDAPSLLRLCRDRGRHSVALLRADPGLVAELQAGSWYDATPRSRALRRALLAGPLQAASARAPSRAAAVRALADAAFWAGLREAAAPSEWRRLTGSAYTALIYHRLAGEMKAGQERLDLPPRRFAAQLRLLRALGWRPLAPEALLAFHSGRGGPLPRRRYVVTVDDAFADVVPVLAAHGAHRPQLYVPTGHAGGAASWAGGEPVATWNELRALGERGTVLGSHTVSHASLPDCDDAALARELEASGEALAGVPGAERELLAYPHGRADGRVRAAAIRAGYRAAFTTDVGRNGAGTDAWSLRRIGIKAHDSYPAFLWKVLTGELLPPRWEARRARAGRP